MTERKERTVATWQRRCVSRCCLEHEVSGGEERNMKRVRQEGIDVNGTRRSFCLQSQLEGCFVRARGEIRRSTRVRKHVRAVRCAPTAEVERESEGSRPGPVKARQVKLDNSSSMEHVPAA